MALHRDRGIGGLAHAVSTGQQYVQVNAYRNVWEVKDVFHLSDDIAHARLARVDEPSIVKTVSCISLAEGSFFELLVDDNLGREEAGHFDGDLTDDPRSVTGANAQWRRNLDAMPMRFKPTLLKRWLRS